jgi:hypothetical protein
LLADRFISARKVTSRPGIGESLIQSLTGGGQEK